MKTNSTANSNFKSLNSNTSTSLLGFSPLLHSISLSLTQYPKFSTLSHRYPYHTPIKTFLMNSPINLNPAPYVSLHKRSGYAFLIGSSYHSYRYRDSVSIFTIKLKAIHHYLEHILSLAPPPGSESFLIIYSTRSPTSPRSVNLLPLIHSLHTLIYSFKHAKPPPSRRATQAFPVTSKSTKLLSKLPTLHESLLPSNDDLTSRIKTYHLSQLDRRMEETLRNKQFTSRRSGIKLGMEGEVSLRAVR